VNDPTKAPTRVNVTYDQPGGGMRVSALNPVVAVIDDLHGHGDAPGPTPFQQPGGKSLDAAVAHFRPKLNLTVPNVIGPAGEELAVELNFTRLPDHWAAEIEQQVPELQLLKQIRRGLLALKAKLLADPKLKSELTALVRRDPDALRKAILALASETPATE
jgi:type VI secretion system protein ImpB